jgi:hypothetical protein
LRSWRRLIQNPKLTIHDGEHDTGQNTSQMNQQILPCRYKVPERGFRAFPIEGSVKLFEGLGDWKPQSLHRPRHPHNFALMMVIREITSDSLEVLVARVDSFDIDDRSAMNVIPLRLARHGR